MTQEAKGVLEALVKNIKKCREVYSDKISDHEVGVLKDAMKEVMTTMNAVANLEEFQDFKHQNNNLTLHKFKPLNIITTISINHSPQPKNKSILNQTLYPNPCRSSPTRRSLPFVPSKTTW